MAKKKPKIQDIVYLKTDPEQKPRMVVKYEVSLAGVNWCLAVGETTSWHQDFEFSSEVINNKIVFN